MSEDFGYSNWLESKSRKVAAKEKYQTGHSYKNRKVDIIGKNKNEYIQILNKNSQVDDIIINVNSNKSSKSMINVPEHCVLSANKKRNKTLVNILTEPNFKINEHIENKGKSKRGAEELEILRYQNENIEYMVSYKLKENSSKDKEVESEIKVDNSVSTQKKKKINKNKVRREKKVLLKDDKKTDESDEDSKKKILDNHFWQFCIIKNDKASFGYLKKIKELKNDEVKEEDFRKYSGKHLNLDDENVTVGTKANSERRSNEAKRIAAQLFKTEFQIDNKKNICFTPLIGCKSYIDSESVRKEFSKELNNRTEASVISAEAVCCEICYATVANLICLTKCQHQACVACWQQYTESTISCYKLYAAAASSNNNVEKIKCLGQNCDTVLNPEFLSSLLPLKMINKYANYYYELRLCKSEKYVKCLNQKCDRILLVNESSNDQTTVCQCNFMICNKCHKESHYPVGCDGMKDYQSNFHLEQHKKYMHVSGQRCPLCKVPIEKNEGCNRMRCICGFSFCWNCLQPLMDHKTCKTTKSLEDFEIQYFHSPLFDRLAQFDLLADEMNKMKINIGPPINKIIQSLGEENLSNMDRIFREHGVSSVTSKQILYNCFMQAFVCIEQAVHYCKYTIIKSILDGNTTFSNDKISTFVSTVSKCWTILKDFLKSFNSFNDVYTIFKIYNELKEKFDTIHYLDCL